MVCLFFRIWRKLAELLGHRSVLTNKISIPTHQNGLSDNAVVWRIGATQVQLIKEYLWTLKAGQTNPRMGYGTNNVLRIVQLNSSYMGIFYSGKKQLMYVPAALRLRFFYRIRPVDIVRQASVRKRFAKLCNGTCIFVPGLMAVW